MSAGISGLIFLQTSAIPFAYQLALRRNRHIGGWVIAAILFNWIAVFLLAVSAYRYTEWSRRSVCLTCNARSVPSVLRQGNSVMQLWLYLLGVPGMVYAVSRKLTETLVCRACGSSPSSIAKTKKPSQSFGGWPSRLIAASGEARHHRARLCAD